MRLTFKSIKNFAFTYPCPRNLREIMKLSLIEREPKQKIVELWQSYHRSKLDCISESLEKHDYDLLLKK
jgi:ATP synthase F1 complex assembly factor 1